MAPSRFMLRAANSKPLGRNSVGKTHMAIEELITLLLTTVLVSITGYYAGVTHKTLKIMQQQSEAITRPYPSVVTSKPANGGHRKSGQWGWPGTVLFYPFEPVPGKPVLVRQLRGPHLRTLGGHFKTGQWWSPQKRPMGMARDSVVLPL